MSDEKVTDVKQDSQAVSDSTEHPKRRPDHELLTKLLEEGELTIQQAMLKAGYSPKVARQGKKKLPIAVRMNVFKRKAALGRSLKPADLEAAVVGQLADNLVDGSDTAVQTCKLLGSYRQVDMWRPDSQVGIIVLTPPPGWDTAVEAMHAIEAGEKQTATIRALQPIDEPEPDSGIVRAEDVVQHSRHLLAGKSRTIEVVEDALPTLNDMRERR